MADAPATAVPVTIVGVHGGEWFGAAADAALSGAETVMGAGRLLDQLPPRITALRHPFAAPLEATLDEAAGAAGSGRRVCLLASGDPGFFGLVRLAEARIGADRLVVHPAPSSVALAFARLGTHWDDAVVVSAHGRPLAAAVEAVLSHPKVAVLVAPDQPPEVLARALRDAGCGPRRVAVCTHLGESGEVVTEGDLETVATGSWDPVSVVVLRAPAAGGDTGMGVAWGLPDDRFAHRDGMITKAEVRAVALGKLALPGAGVLWDVGAGSGSVAIECARLAPGLRVFAVERRGDDCARLMANSSGTGVRVVEGEAPGALAALPEPDRVFVGGGGLDVLDEVRRRVRPGGTVVATYAALDRATAAASRLGSVVQVAVSRGVPIGAGGSLRLAVENPVFVCWGPGLR